MMEKRRRDIPEQFLINFCDFVNYFINLVISLFVFTCSSCFSSISLVVRQLWPSGM